MPGSAWCVRAGRIDGQLTGRLSTGRLFWFVVRMSLPRASPPSCLGDGVKARVPAEVFGRRCNAKKRLGVSRRSGTNRLRFSPWMSFHPPEGTSREQGSAGSRAGCMRQGKRIAPLTRTFGVGSNRRFMSGRRVADKDGSARGTVCRHLHLQALNAHLKIPFSIFPDACSGRDGFLLTRRVGALRAAGRTPCMNAPWETVTTRRWSGPCQCAVIHTLSQ